MNGIPLTHNVFAFIQARTTSNRLPNKVLRLFVDGKTILHFIVERVHKVLPKSKIVLLIPEGDQPLVQFAEENQILFFEGSEQDVRNRFIQAAKKFQATWILRLTGDNPFVDVEHLSYLIEATRFTNYDLLSFEQLPIGMGAEIFRTSALVREPKSGITPEHSEHVSLHIKQYPAEYSVLKLKPLVRDLDSNTQIRLTIDEEVDFLTCRDIYLEFQNNEFGVKEILTLYKEKPEIFQKNKSVQQMKFFIPTISSYNESTILIVHAPTIKHGFGHLRRMTLLKIYLESLKIKVEMIDNLEEFQTDSNFQLCILDYRNEKLPKNANSKKWIKIDNFSIREGEESYFYSLPHPSLQDEEYEDSLFVPLSYFWVERDSKPEGVLVYTSGVQDSSFSYFLKWLEENFSYQKIFIVGKEISNSRFTCFKNLTPFEFYSFMSKCEYFLSYFGQSLLEAFCLGCQCFSFSISPYHTILSKFIEEKYGLPFLGELEDKSLNMKNFHITSKPMIYLRGYEKLLSLILEKLKN